MTWLGDPIILRRWHVISAGVVVGVICAVAILTGTSALRNAAKFDARRRGDDRAQLQREAISHREVVAIARRQARLEKPTASDLLAAIRRAGSLCRRRPRACAQAAHGFTAAALAPMPSRRTSTTGRDQLEPTRLGDRRDDTSPPSTSPTRRPSRPPDTSSPPAQTTPTSPPTSPNRPPAPVTITPPATGIPLVDGVMVCDGLVDVRCP
jgi:hypothetical protein